VITDHARRRTYECDGLAAYRVIPGLVVLARDAADVAATVRACAARGVPFVARRSGTRLTGRAQLRAGPSGLQLAVELEVGSPGRYELRGSIDGQGIAHAARWLEPGRASLVLEFPSLPADGALLRDLRLMDQSRMAVLHVQAEALRLSEPTSPTHPRERAQGKPDQGD
jgi:hypothetical protein